MSVITFLLLFLLVPPAAADWERLRPETEAPPVIAPEPDAVCREKARRIDASGGQAEEGIPDAAATDRQWFMRRCFTPRICPAAQAAGVRLQEWSISGPYERLVRLCGG